MAVGDIHHTTPKKAGILATVRYLEQQRLPYTKEGVFRTNHVSHARGWVILHEGRERRHLEIETRGRKKLISPEQIQAMEKILWAGGFEARKLSWLGLALEAGISGISSHTIARAMGRFWLLDFLPFWLLFLTPG
jgi:hypothetical protein